MAQVRHERKLVAERYTSMRGCVIVCGGGVEVGGSGGGVCVVESPAAPVLDGVDVVKHQRLAVRSRWYNDGGFEHLNCID